MVDIQVINELKDQIDAALVKSSADKKARLNLQNQIKALQASRDSGAGGLNPVDAGQLAAFQSAMLCLLGAMGTTGTTGPTTGVAYGRRHRARGR